MSALIDQFRIAWSEYAKSSVPILAAVSGGADSVALAQLLHGTHTASPIILAHFNHDWRGADSAADAQFVSDLAQKLNWDYELGSADPGSEHTEETARTERYRFLTEVAQKRGARYLAVAHTANDHVETILHRVLRGTGIDGLAGIPSTRVLTAAVTLVRPLLSFKRDELLGYLKDINQDYRDDASNSDLKYTRNRLRHELLPHLRENYNSHVDEALLRLGEIAADSYHALTPARDELIDRFVVFSSEAVRIDVAAIDVAAINADPQPTYVLTMMFNEIWQRQDWPRQAMGFGEWRRLISLLQRKKETVMLPGGITATRQDGLLELRR